MSRIDALASRLEAIGRHARRRTGVRAPRNAKSAADLATEVDAAMAELARVRAAVAEQPPAPVDALQLRAVVTTTSRAEERERRRIAAAIHDRVSQTLALTKMKVQALREAVAPDRVGDVDEAAGLVAQAVQETRTIMFELSPPILYELGLVAAVEWLAEQVQRRDGLRVEVAATPHRDAAPADDVRVLLFHAVRELLSNVVRHARAKAVRVRLTLRKGSGWHVSVEDNGDGFAAPAAESGAADGRIGLLNLRLRLEQAGGRMDVKTTPGKGSRVGVFAPIPSAAANGQPDRLARR
jgi:signal transduction histidine kinase